MSKPLKTAVKRASDILADYVQPGPRNCERTLDDLKNRGPQDRSRINTTEDHEVGYWTRRLGISDEELRSLVAQHGNSSDKIRRAVAVQRAQT